MDDKNWIKEQFISSQAFHRTAGGRIQKIILREQFEPRILESFDLVTQELYRHLPTMIHDQLTDSNTQARKYTEDGGSQQELVIAAGLVALDSHRD
jgi:hypothetical protein